MSIFKKRKRKEKHKYTTDAITFNKSGVPKEHPFKLKIEDLKVLLVRV